MTRAAKIQKLGNAIRRYRGLKRGDQWINAPQPHAEADVLRLCASLGLPAETIHKINAFASFAEFRAFLNKL